MKNKNTLIALFDGFEFVNDDPIAYPNGYYHHEEHSAIIEEDLQYNTDWNWLMPVLEKICRLKVGDGVNTVDYSFPRTFGMINEENDQIMVRLNGHQVFEAGTLLDAVYIAIIDFIECHDNTKTI